MNLVTRAIAKLKRVQLQRQLDAAVRRYSAMFPTTTVGTPEWLIGCELKYGGFVTNVPRNKVSPNDARSPEELHRGGMTGGDRMLHHGYANDYSRFLLPLAKEGSTPTIMEIGILVGTGLAVWCDLFPSGRVIGMDIDLGHFENNRNNLLAKGAFQANSPELHHFDQLLDDSNRVSEILNGGKIDVGIDDGLHSDEAILNTLRALEPHFAPQFVHFIEDNDVVAPILVREFPQFRVESKGFLTIVHPRESQQK